MANNNNNSGVVRHGCCVNESADKFTFWQLLSRSGPSARGRSGLWSRAEIIEVVGATCGGGGLGGGLAAVEAGGGGTFFF